MALEVVVGPMFSGKSTYALSYIRRQQVIGKKVVVVKPNIDTRYSDEQLLVTHNQEKTPCMLWSIHESLDPTVTEIRQADCIVLEEAQFFQGLETFVMYVLRAYQKNILVVGLDGDAHQGRFGEILNCIPWATTVTKLCAFCRRCRDGTLAPFTRRISNEHGQQVDVGSSDKYEAVCLKHLADT